MSVRALTDPSQVGSVMVFQGFIPFFYSFYRSKFYRLEDGEAPSSTPIKSYFIKNYVNIFPFKTRIVWKCLTEY